MKKYLAEFNIVGTCTVEIEAESLDEAEEKARKYDYDSVEEMNEWEVGDFVDVYEVAE